MLTHYEDMKGDEKCKNWGVLGGVRGHPRSSETYVIVAMTTITSRTVQRAVMLSVNTFLTKPCTNRRSVSQCRTLANVDKITRVPIDTWCTQLSRVKSRVTGQKPTKFIRCAGMIVAF